MRKRALSILCGVTLFLVAVVIVHAFIAAQPPSDTSWSAAIQAATALLLVAITALYVDLTARMVRVQQESLDRSSEEPRVRDLKQALDEGPDYANHFEQLRKWLPIKLEDVVDDREIDEFNTNAWHLDDLARELSVAAPQLPPNIRSNCQHLAELIKQARHDLARLSEAAGQEKLRALREGKDATWDRARDQFGGHLIPWMELLQGQAARDLGPAYKELHRILQARIDSYGPRPTA
jgi:hypothetical protein